MPISFSGTNEIRRIIAAYDPLLVRWYSRCRFLILRQHFLEEIEQYLPEKGTVLDVGCGFGLFSLYFAMRNPNLQIQGFDLNAGRIQLANVAAKKLGLTNVVYHVGDAREYSAKERLDGAYMLDIVHHIPQAAVEPLMRNLHANLAAGSRLIVKDIETAPRYKLLFTYLLDKAMDFRAPVRYWPARELVELLVDCGFKVYKHSMLDYLPYPHVLYNAVRQPDQENPA